MDEGFSKTEDSGVERLFGGEVELSLWQRKKLGEKKAIEELFLINRGLVFEILNKNFRVSYSESSFKPDMEQEGLLALFNAILCFDPDRGIQFSTYAHKCIRNGIFNFLCRMNRIISFNSENFVDKKSGTRDASQLNEFDQFLGLQNFDQLFLERDHFVGSEEFDAVDLREWREIFLLEVERLIQKSRVENKENLRSIFYGITGYKSVDFESKMLREIGDVLGFSRQRVSKIFENLLDSIRNNPIVMEMLSDL